MCEGLIDDLNDFKKNSEKSGVTLNDTHIQASEVSRIKDTL